MQTSEAACVYAALILQDDGVEIDAAKINTLIEAAGVEVESIWATLFAKALAGKDLGEFLFNVGSGGPAASGGAAAAPAAAGGAPAKEAVKEAEPEAADESDDDMGFGLFD